MIYLPNMFLFSEFSGKYPFCERRIWVLDDGYVLCAASTSAIKVSQAGMPQNNDSNGEFLNVGNVINQPNFDGLYMFIPPKKKWGMVKLGMACAMIWVWAAFAAGNGQTKGWIFQIIRMPFQEDASTSTMWQQGAPHGHTLVGSETRPIYKTTSI